MSLIHWYPLNGDTKDYGINPIHGSLLTGGSVTSTAGKIGANCLSGMTGSDNAAGVTVPTNLLDELHGQGSVAVWIKINGTHVHYNGTILSSGDWNQKQWAFGVSQDNQKVDVFSNGYNCWVSCPISTGVWHHLCCTNDNGVCKVYLDGVYKGSANYAMPFESTATNMCIGRETYAGGYFSFNGCINDVRIYDHALSQLEVSEIAKACVLHYDFEDNTSEPTINLAAGLSGASDNYFTTQVEMYATYLGSVELDNAQFTYSMYIKNNSDHPVAARFNPYNAANTGYSTWFGNFIAPGEEGYSTITHDISDASAWSGRFYAYIQNGNAGTVPTNRELLVKEVQIERKDHRTGFTTKYRLGSNKNLGNTSADYHNKTYGQAYGLGCWGGDNGTVTFYKNGGYNDLPYKVYSKTATGSGGVYYKTDNDIVIQSGKTYTVSCWIKASRDYRDSSYSFCINRGSDNSYIVYPRAVHFTTKWKHIAWTFTATSAQAGNYGEMSIIYDDTVTNYQVYFSGFKVEEGSVATMYTPPQYETTNNYIYDCSGYNRHADIHGLVPIYENAGRGQYYTTLNAAGNYLELPSLSFITSGTVSFWARYSTDGYKMILGSDEGGLYLGARSNANWYHGGCGSVTAYRDGDATGALLFDNKWHHYVFTGVNFTGWSGHKFFLCVYANNPTSSFKFNGDLADFQLFATALTATQVKTLYERKAAIGKNGSLVTDKIVSTNKSEELLFGTLIGAQFNSYRQSGSAYRIYNDAQGNLVLKNTVWGWTPKFAVKAGETLYYDVVFSNTSGNWFYMGFEQFDEDGNSGSNELCNYIINTSDAQTTCRVKGTINVRTAAPSGKPIVYWRLRLLNAWNGSSDTKICTIHSMSLRRISSITTQQIEKENYILADDFREYKYTDEAAMYKNGFVGATNIIEN